MKNIKQLKKEIEELKHKVSENIGKVDEINISVWDDQIKWKKIQLQTLQKVCEEIKKDIISLKIAKTCKGINIKKNDSQIHILNFILKKFQGEEIIK